MRGKGPGHPIGDPNGSRFGGDDPDHRVGGKRRGITLPVVLLLLLVLTALAHGALSLAAGNGALARARAARLQARLLAEGGLRRVSELLDEEEAGSPDLPPTRFYDLPTPRPGLHLRLDVEDLGPEWRLVTARARARILGSGARERLARVVWTADPVVRTAAMGGAVEHGGTLLLEGGSRLSGGPFTATPPGWEKRHCGRHRPALDSLAAAGSVAPSLRLAPDDLPGAPGPDASPYEALPPLALLEGPLLAEGARTGFSGSVTPRPLLRWSRCAASEETNWGSPGDPDGPCGRHFVRVAAPGDLGIEGGEGQGILLVAGGLTVEEGARFVGLVEVGGDLVLRGGSRIDGWVRVGGRVHLHEASEIHASGCAVVRTLDEALLPGPHLVPPTGSWLDPF